MKVRTRFAPSPTGLLHVGGVRTALFAWLLARQSNGQFILRIEDTDQTREVSGSSDHIQKCLESLGLDWDEGPFFQSKRLDNYKKWAQKLIDSGRAYADPYSTEEVGQFRRQAKIAKKPYLYRNHRPENPPVWDGSAPLRFKSEPKAYDWHDEVMGDLSTGPEVVDDFILIKSDGYPTYNFAHIVDDADMQISYVIRGQEFISSMPNYLNLYEALDLERPIFATMPHILNEQGNKKLSKRDGAKDVLDYIKEGFLPETLVNFIAGLGWNDGTTQEIFSVKDLVKKFSLKHVQKSGARFDEKRLVWLNGQHIRRLNIDKLSELVASFWPDVAKTATSDYKNQVLEVVQDRLHTLADLPLITSYFFAEPTLDWSMITKNKQLNNVPKQQLINLLEVSAKRFEQTDFTVEKLQIALNQLLEETQQKPMILFSLIRFALTWAPFSPGLPETMQLLGKEKTLDRLKTVIKS